MIVITPDFRYATWCKSSRSEATGGSCVEIASAEGAVGVRDSTDTSGPVLVFSRREWDAFLTRARAGGFRIH